MSCRCAGPARGPVAASSGADTLTLLPDRAALRHHIASVLRRPSKRGSAALIVIELNGLREIGNVLGADYVDALLIAVAGRLRASVRGSDMLASLGGDRFAILLSDIPDAAGALARAQTIADLLARVFIVRREVATIEARVGIALGTAGLRNPDEMIRRAHLALSYDVPTGPRGGAVFNPAMDVKARAQRELGIALRRALPMREFELFYQPQLDVVTRRLVGFEALIRWRHRTRGMVSPAEFIPLAERLGLIGSIGEWALRTACAEASRWPAGLTVAVNVSPLQFVAGSDMARTARRALAETGLPPDRLELEITESTLLGSTATTQATLHALKQLGAGISMDDFGTGYSSLGQLRSFPFNKLKIDQSFIRDLVTKPDAAHMLRAIATLGAGLGMSVIAEGVETEEQAAAVAQQGCSLIQGYLISRPVPRDQIDGIIARFGVR